MFFWGIIIFLRVCCAFSLGCRAAGRGGWNSFPPLRQHLFFMPRHVGTPLWYVLGLWLCCSWSFLSFFGCRGCETFSGFVYISRKKGAKSDTGKETFFADVGVVVGAQMFTYLLNFVKHKSPFTFQFSIFNY